MKKISTLFASLILAIAVFAAERPKSTLTIQSFDKAGLRVVIDGRRFEPNDNYLTINGIEPGVHQVKIYHQKNNGIFSILGSRYEVVFNGSLNINQRSNTMISVDRFGKAIVSTSRTTGRSDRYGRGSNRGNDFDFERGARGGDYTNDRGNDRGGSWGGYDNNNGYESGMNDREFRTVLQSIDKEWLESNKLKSASHIVTSNRLSTAQVKQLVLLFSFESNKLDLAKQAYTNTVDKRNYSMLNDVFSFNSSKDELARFIRNFR